MERLTGWDGDRVYLFNMPVVEMDAVALDIITKAVYRLAAYEDTGLEPEEIKACMDGLDEYRKAEEEGHLAIMPCKVGDMVYYIDGGKSYKAKAVAFRITESGLRVYCERNFMGHIGFEGVYGITVFLTREEAEGALKEETT